MSKRIFSEWFNTFRESINGYDYYVNFDNVCRNAGKFEIEINILNCLIGSDNIEEKFRFIMKKYPECLKAIPILLAVRKSKIYCQDENGAFNYDFENANYSIDQYVYFMRETGLFNMLQNRIISSLYDYVTGVETGLEAIAIKNSGSHQGHQMENLVESFIRKSGVEYYPQMYLEDIQDKWHIDLSRISSGGTSTKKFDFAVKTEKFIYAIETNFYTSGGSKLNETARSYKMLAEESKLIKGFKFVWITDGAGWASAKHNLEETFNAMPHIYNISDMEAGIFDTLFI